MEDNKDTGQKNMNNAWDVLLTQLHVEGILPKGPICHA